MLFMNKKISSFGYCCFGKPCDVQCWQDDAGKQFVELNGFRSEKVDDLYARDRNDNLVIWELVRSVEAVMKNLYG